MKQLSTIIIAMLCINVAFSQGESKRKNRKKKAEISAIDSTRQKRNEQLRIETSRFKDSSFQMLDEQTDSYFAVQGVVPAAIHIEGYTLRGVSVFLDGKKKSVKKHGRSMWIKPMV